MSNARDLSNNRALTLGTTQTTTSGTSKDFTGIPPWATRVTIMLKGVSVSGTSSLLVQLGTSSGIVTTGYVSVANTVASSGVAVNSNTNGFMIQGGNAGYILYGSLAITSMTGNDWAGDGSCGNNAVATYATTTAGAVSLGGTLDRIRLTTVNGTDTFDAGSVNILYE